MPNIAAFFAPFALFLPFPSADEKPREESVRNKAELAAEADIPRPMPVRVWLTTLGPDGEAIQYQVRIEQRLIIRVSPRRSPARQNMNAPAQRPTKVVEKKMGKCVKMNGIAGVQSSRDNRLLLYMRDQRIIAASLEKACRARDFYSGFYVEPSKDGNLCVQRDKLQTRTGVKCKLSNLKQLVREPV